MSITASLKNFEAVSEFWHYTDTCGETAFLVLEHCKDGIALNGADVDAVREDMASHGYGVVGGTTMSELVHYFTAHRGLACEEVCAYGSSESQIHSALLAHAGRRGVVLQVAAAYNLIGNEGGVHSHFVAIGAIHPTLGYLVANGDDVNALASHDGHGKIIPTRWMSWATIEAAQPRAVAIIYGLDYQELDNNGLEPLPTSVPVVTPIPQTPPTPTPNPTPTPDPVPATPVVSSGVVLSELLAVVTALDGVSKQLATVVSQMRELLK